MLTILLFLLAACSTATTDTGTPTLGGQEVECPRDGLAVLDVEPGFPLVAVCTERSCQPASTWVLAESITVPCSTGSTVVLTWR